MNPFGFANSAAMRSTRVLLVFRFVLVPHPWPDEFLDLHSLLFSAKRFMIVVLCPCLSSLP
jgi:hypothetical protein